MVQGACYTVVAGIDSRLFSTMRGVNFTRPRDAIYNNLVVLPCILHSLLPPHKPYGVHKDGSVPED